MGFLFDARVHSRNLLQSQTFFAAIQGGLARVFDEQKDLLVASLKECRVVIAVCLVSFPIIAFVNVGDLDEVDGAHRHVKEDEVDCFPVELCRDERLHIVRF